jgi:hypothetical protein
LEYPGNGSVSTKFLMHGFLHRSAEIGRRLATLVVDGIQDSRSVSCQKIATVCQFLANVGSKSMAQIVANVEGGTLAPPLNAQFRPNIFAQAIVTQIAGVLMGCAFTR